MTETVWWKIYIVDKDYGNGGIGIDGYGIIDKDYGNGNAGNSNGS